MKDEDFRTTQAVIELLAERFPKAFWIYERRRKPLKIGIHHDLIATLDGALTERELHLGLGWYTRNRAYRAKLVKGAWRIDLDGNIAATISQNLNTASDSKRPALPRNKAIAAARSGPRTAM